MGNREVLGQAARLASTGLLLQVSSAPPAAARPAAGVPGEAALGPLRARPGADPVLEWTPLPRGPPEAVAAAKGPRGPESAFSPAERLQANPVPSEHCISQMVVGEG